MKIKTQAPAKTEVKAQVPVTTAPKGEVSVINDLAGQLRCRPDKLLTLLKGTVFRNCKRNEEFQMACMVAREYKLNPILKEIYAFPSQNGVVPIISIDGWIRIINSHPKYAGCKFVYDGKITSEGEGTLSCTCEIYRTDRAKPIAVQEFYEECYRDTDPWNGMPRRMLRWKALIQCARVAFGFAGIYDFDEGNDILSHEGKRVTKDGNIIDVEVEDIGGDGNEADGGDNVLPDEPDPTADEEETETTQTGDDDGDGDEPSDGDEGGMPW